MTSPDSDADPPPIVARFPALARIPRRRLGMFPTPLDSATTPSGAHLWIKRDDRTSPLVGGNKVRALEFLLGPVAVADTVVTVGGDGSTHVLATALHARALGARTVAYMWAHEMNDSARATARRIREAEVETRRSLNAVTALARSALVAWWQESRGRRWHWVPPGGTSPLGALGHIGAALEFVQQADARALPRELTVVVPLGTGGTAAGLALGFAIARRPVSVLAVRVVPRVVANLMRVRGLAGSTARLIERVTGETVPLPPRDGIRIDHDRFGGAYGRETPAGHDAAQWAGARYDLVVDATYSAKALAAAHLEADRGPTVFWLTYDGRGGASAATHPPPPMRQPRA